MKAPRSTPHPVHRHRKLAPLSAKALRTADEQNRIRTAPPTFVTHATLDAWKGKLLLRLRCGVEVYVPKVA